MRRLLACAITIADDFNVRAWLDEVEALLERAE